MSQLNKLVLIGNALAAAHVHGCYYENKILYIFKLHQLLLLTKTDSILFFKKKHISPKQLNLQEKKGLKTCVMCF